MAYTIPSDTHTAGNSGHVTDHNNIADMLKLNTGINLANTAYAGGADPTGATFSDAALAAALAALGSNYGQIIIPPGTYKFNNSHTFGPGQGLVCPEGFNNDCTIYYHGDSSFIHAYDPAFNIDLPYPTSPGPTFSGFTIDGTSAGSAAVGFELGDLQAPTVNLQIQNFTGATAIGAWFNNTVGWVEYGFVTINLINCTSCVVFDNNGGLSTFDAMAFQFTVALQPNQNGVTWQNGAYQQTGTFILYGGAQGALSTNSGNVVNMVNGGLKYVQTTIACECDYGTGTVGPVSINFNSSNGQFIGFGLIAFTNQSGTFQSSNCYQNYSFAFSGYITVQTSGDPLGVPGINGTALIVNGGSLWTFGTTDGGGTGKYIYNGTGDFFGTTLASGANTFSLYSPIAGRPQRMLWQVTQPASGSAATLTLTGAKTTAGSGVLTLSSTNNYVDVIDVWTPDGATVYAAVVGLNFH